MPRKQRSELTAGIFTIAALAILVGVIFWLGAADIFKTRGQRAYFFATQDRGRLGLQVGGYVLVNDVEVGKIAGIEWDAADQKTYYIVQLHTGDLKVYSNGKAKIAAALVGGANLVITDPGTPEPPETATVPAEPTGAAAREARTQPVEEDIAPADRKKYAVKIQPGDFDKALSQVDTLARKLHDIATKLSLELDRDLKGSTMAKVHKMADTLQATLVSLRNEMDPRNKLAMLAKLHETIGRIRAMAADAQPRIKKTLTDIEAMAADARPKVGKTLSDAAEVAAELKKITKKDIAEMLVKLRKVNTDLVTIAGNFATVSDETKRLVTVNRENIDEIIDNMVAVSADLKSAGKEIRRSPWRLLYQPKKDELHSQNIYDAARAFSSGASQLDQMLAKLRGLVRAYPKGPPADDPQLKKIREQIKETFESFSEAEKALWEELGK